MLTGGQPDVWTECLNLWGPFPPEETKEWAGAGVGGGAVGVTLVQWAPELCLSWLTGPIVPGFQPLLKFPFPLSDDTFGHTALERGGFKTPNK